MSASPPLSGSWTSSASWFSATRIWRRLAFFLCLDIAIAVWLIVLFQNVDGLVQSQTNRLLATVPSLLVLYLKFRKDQATASSVWHSILETVGRSPEEFDTMFPALLDAAESQQLPPYLRPHGEELEQAVGNLLTDALSGTQNASRVSLIRRLLTSYGMFS